MLSASVMAKLERIANSLPTIGEQVRLCGDTAWGQTYFAYGQNEDKKWIGLWAAEKGDFKLYGRYKVELGPDATSDNVLPTLIKCAENEYAAMSENQMTELGWWSHNRGH